MGTMGWPHDFHVEPWEQVLVHVEQRAEKNSEFRYLADIAASVVTSGVADELAVCTSHFDLLVTMNPPSPPPLELVWVHAPERRTAAQQSHVRIEHRSLSGRNDEIERPINEAVALFWRFMIEKFGIAPVTR